MSSGFAAEDLASFFETDGHGIKGVITGPSFSRELNGVFDLTSQDMPIYPETNVDADDAIFECKTTDLAGVARGMRLDFPELEPHEDGYGKSFQICRLALAGTQSTKIHLKEV